MAHLSHSFFGLMKNVGRINNSPMTVRMTTEVDLSEVIKVRETSLEKVTYTACILKAIALAIKEGSEDTSVIGFNSYLKYWPIKKIQRFNHINAGVAIERKLEGCDIAFHVMINHIEDLSIYELTEKLQYYSKVDITSDLQYKNTLRMMRLPSFLQYALLSFAKYIPHLRLKHYGSFLLSTVGKYGPDVQYTTAETIPTFGFGLIKKRPIVIGNQLEIRQTVLSQRLLIEPS